MAIKPGVIRKISVGSDVSRHYQVGTTPNTDKIEHNVEYLEKYGVNRYTIFFKDDDGKFVPWKHFDNLPVIAEMDLSA